MCARQRVTRPGALRRSRDIGDMGRRSRRRSSTGDTTQPRRRSAGQTARVRVDDAIWRDFREAIGDRSVAEALGNYVEAEVARWHRRRAEDDQSLTDRELAEALERAQTLSATLTALVERLEMRLRFRR